MFSPSLLWRGQECIYIVYFLNNNLGLNNKPDYSQYFILRIIVHKTIYLTQFYYDIIIPIILILKTIRIFLIKYKKKEFLCGFLPKQVF